MSIATDCGSLVIGGFDGTSLPEEYAGALRQGRRGGAILFQSLPGFRVFRQPARMLLVVALPVALLAGQATEALIRRAMVHAGLLNA